MASTLIVEVCKINEIQPHPNADRLEMARIKNWWCVVRKDDHVVGEKVVYIPPETVVPEGVAEAWGVKNFCAQLPTYGDGRRPEGVRVRAIRLRGVPSQGLIIPLENKDWEVGHSVVEHYGLSKYEPPTPVNAGEAIIPPDGFRKYTDLEHLGNFIDLFQDGEEVVVEEKIHGTNGRAAIIDGEFHCGAFNQCLKEVSDDGKPSVYWTSMTDGMRSLLKELYIGVPVIVFVEIYGRKIQDMEYGMTGVGFCAYDIAVNGQFLDYDTRMDLFKKHEIPTAPLLYRGPFSMKEMEKLVDGPTMMCKPEDAGIFKGREGIVIRPVVETYDLTAGRKIAKMVSVDYHQRRGDKTEYH